MKVAQLYEKTPKQILNQLTKLPEIAQKYSKLPQKLKTKNNRKQKNLTKRELSVYILKLQKTSRTQPHSPKNSQKWHKEAQKAPKNKESEIIEK